MKIQPVAKRTFYIERYGNEYRLVQTWEAGTVVDPEKMQRDSFQRVMSTNPDERIIAEQQLGIVSTPNGVRITGEMQQVKQAAEVTQQIMKDGTTNWYCPGCGEVLDSRSADTHKCKGRTD